MKNKFSCTLLFICLFTYSIFAQEQKKDEPGTCRPDSLINEELSTEDVLKWAEAVPLKVYCENGKYYILNFFEISIFTLNPLQSTEYGVGEKGVPLYAQMAIKKMKPGDTLILKNANYLDENQKEQKLPFISFSVKK